MDRREQIPQSLIPSCKTTSIFLTIISPPVLLFANQIKNSKKKVKKNTFIDVSYFKKYKMNESY